MTHFVLLGDSIFDNARYTRSEPDVISQVRRFLPSEWKASLLALDGATTEDVPLQLQRMPLDASHLVLSVGGNDALLNSSILYSPANSASQVVAALAAVSKDFEEKYRRAFQELISTALMIFNDVILRVGIEFGLTIIDLRFVCSSPADYANPIEPSSVGGEKIARAIVSLASDGPAQSRGARVVTS